MIIDSHCHAWTYWPYNPPVPDPESRGRVEQLLNEMNLHGVDKAVIICAQIDHNPNNNEYIAQVAAQHSDRLYQFPDVDCAWSTTYHTPGAADRLRVGVLCWNRPTAGASGRLPFGGVRESGNHRPAGILAGLTCTDAVGVLLTPGHRDPLPSWPGLPFAS